jgi:hypothetical protein
MRRYWVIAPQHTKYWESAWRFDLAHNIISLGWNDLGDISSLSETQLKKRISREYHSDGLRSNNYTFRSLWNFYHAIKPGHVIVASQGRRNIAAVGVVTCEAYYEHNKNAQAVPDDPYSNNLGVRWEQEPRGKPIASMLGRQAICEITEERFQALTRTKPVGGMKLGVGAKMIGGSGSPLPRFDDAEVSAAIKARTIAYRRRHNKMTNALKRLWSRFELKRGNHSDCLYDVLVENYNGTGRDLLLELKPDPDKGAVRIAIGQLYDYRRYLPNRSRTDLAVLTIARPAKAYLDLLLNLGISALWFQNDKCESLQGKGLVSQTGRLTGRQARDEK